MKVSGNDHTATAIDGEQSWPEVFPLVYRAADDAADLVAFARWTREHRDRLLTESGRHGALLFRGFPLAGADDFDCIVQSFDLDNFAYDNSLSNAVRHNVSQRVFTANEAPPEIAIYLHHEMAQTPFYPSRLFFYCEQAAESGGATPLCRSDVLLARLQQRVPEFVQQCRSLGIRYSNVMPGDDDPASGQGRSWRRTLRVADREAAEARLHQLGYTWQWLNDDSLRVITAVLPAVRPLPDGREVFFNQVIAASRGWQDRRNQASNSIRYGDGAHLDNDHLAILHALSDELTFDLDWETGDMALIDNFLVMHGRRPFTGKRRVLASLVA